MISDEKDTSPTARKSFRRRFFPAPLAIFILVATFGCHQLSGQKTAPAPSGAELFKSKCSHCHDPDLALNKYRSAEAWFDTITRMKEQHKADISRDDIDTLVKYHVERQHQEASLFKEKCEQCHPGSIFLGQKLRADQARAIIRRMQQQAGNKIEDKDVEIIVRYHVQAQQAALDETMSGISAVVLRDQPHLKKIKALFVNKCSECHQSSRALGYLKDRKVWDRTLKRMQYYSKGAITNREIDDLVDFHVTQQQQEIDTFKKTCTKCHDDTRINNRSMSEEQWLETIKRMQQKAPELISNEKVSLLAAYFHRRELTLARIFHGRCHLCHPDGLGATPAPSSNTAMKSLSTRANAEYGKSLQVTDKELLSVHVERQKRALQLYERKCFTCHPNGLPNKTEPGRINPDRRTRAEWISFIATLQGLELTKDVQDTIDGQIDYHLSRH
ncbi:MAG TPA: c-type cytochrome [Geothermobacteraceae bacterium]|nr:c-type cytochrome [Geothermobacteraceae bacterium]